MSSDQGPEPDDVTPMSLGAHDSDLQMVELDGGNRFDERQKLQLVSLMTAVVTAAYAACSLFPNATLLSPSGAVLQYMAPSHQRPFYVCSLVLATVSFMVGRGGRGIKRIVGRAGIQLNRVLPSGNQPPTQPSGAASRNPPLDWCRKAAIEPDLPAGEFQRQTLVCCLIIAWALLGVLVTLTGGIQSSVFLQFAISAFFWQLLHAHQFRWRFATFGASMAFVVLLTLLPTPDEVEDFHVKGWVFCLITASNLGFQLIPLLLADLPDRDEASI